MNEEQNLVSTAIPEDNRVYYTYGDQQIDLKHYIHNLNSNLNRFLDSRRGWSEGQKQAFRDKFELLNQGLQQQLESGNTRFDTSTNGYINDSEEVFYVGEDSDELDKALNDYADRIGGAIAVRGLNKDYYDRLYSAKVKEAERKAAVEAARSATQVEDRNETEGYDPDKYGFISYLRSDEDLYKSADNSFNWSGVFALDQDDPNKFTNRTTALVNRISDYYNRVSQYPLDFTGSQYGSKEEYLNIIKAAHDALQDGYQESDNQALNAIGLDNEFLENWFSTKSPEERVAVAAQQAKETELLNELAEIPVNFTKNSPLENNGWTIQSGVSFNKKGDTSDIPAALDQLAKIVGKEVPYYEEEAKVASYIQDIEKEIVTNMLTGTNYDRTAKLIQGLLAYDEVIKPYTEEGIFLDGNDGLKYLDYRDASSGVSVVYNPKTQKIYLKKLTDSVGSPIYNKIIESIASMKLGGKFLDGGEIAALNTKTVKQIQGDDPKKFNHAQAKNGWNSQGTTMSNKNFNMEYEDYARIVTLAANIGSMFADPLTGAAIGVGATVGDLTADLADESLSGWDAAGNLAANLGLDLVALIPGMESLKIARSIGKLAKPLTAGLAAYGVLDGISNAEGILTGIKNVAEGNYSRQDFQNATQGIMLLASAIKGGQSFRKNRKAAKLGKEKKEIGVKIRRDGKVEDVKFKGEAAEKIRAAGTDVTEINKILKTLPGFENTTVETRLKTIPLKYQAPIKLKPGEGESHFRKPITTRVEADVFETVNPGTVGLFGSKKLNTISRRTPTDIANPEIKQTQASTTEASSSKPTGSTEDKINIPSATFDDRELIPTVENLKTREEVLKVKEKSELKRGQLADLDTKAKGIEDIISQAESSRTAASETLDQITKLRQTGITPSYPSTHKMTVVDDATAGACLKKLAENKIDIKKHIAALESKIEEKKRKKQSYSTEKKELEQQRATLVNIDQAISEVEGWKNSAGKTAEKTAKANLDSADQSLVQQQAEKKKIEELIKNIKSESTGLEDLKKQLVSEGAAEADIAKIIEDLGLIYKEGGILKFQSGGSTNIWDAITWDLSKRYRNVYNNGKWELSERGNTVNTNNISSENNKYDLESGNAEQVKQREQDLENFYKLLTTNKDIAEKWASQYKALNAAKGIGDVNQKGWWNKDGSFNFEGFKTSGAISGKKLWADQKNGIGHDVYKGKTYYIKGPDGKETYFSTIPEGYTASTVGTQHDPLITKYLLTKNGTTSAENPEENPDELEYPSFDEVNGEFAGNSYSPMMPKESYYESFLQKIPYLAEYLRLKWLNNKADKLTDIALEGTQPFLQDPYSLHRYIYGNYRAKAEGEQAAAQLMSLAYRPLTSDGALQTAAQFEAKNKGQQYIDAGNKADDATIRENQEKSWLQEKDNIYNSWKIAMENRRNLATNLADRAKIRHAGESVKTNNTNTYWMDIIKNTKEYLAERKDLLQQANMKDVARLATLNPSALGIELSHDEQVALNGVVHGGLTYTTLPKNYQQAYLSARQKLQWAESNYARKMHNLPESPYRDAILQGLNDNWEQISDAVAFKNGGQVTIAKIKEKIKNADRHQKNIHKQIDSLDRKLDRISRSMYGVGKVAQLR